MPSLPIPVFAALILAFLFARLWLSERRMTLLGALLGLCAAQTLIITLAQHYGLTPFRFLQPITATFVPPLAWLAFLAATRRSAERRDVVHVAAPCLALILLAALPDALDVLIPATFVTYGTTIALGASKGADAQPQAVLQSGDVPARIWLVIGAALIASALSDVMIVTASLLGADHWRPWIISVFSVGNLVLIGALGLSGQAHRATEEAPAPEQTRPDPADEALWQEIESYMAERQPYLDPDLTLAKLARKLGVPAKSVSETVNRATGDNVSRYVNAARIAAAQDAMRSGENITSAMFSAGFNTKSNFNREFLRVVKATPTAWRDSLPRPKDN